jgi:hypothetical protein
MDVVDGGERVENNDSDEIAFDMPMVVAQSNYEDKYPLLQSFVDYEKYRKAFDVRLFIILMLLKCIMFSFVL